MNIEAILRMAWGPIITSALIIGLVCFLAYYLPKRTMRTDLDWIPKVKGMMIVVVMLFFLIWIISLAAPNLIPRGVIDRKPIEQQLQDYEQRQLQK